MGNKNIIGILLVPAFVLLVPLVAMQFTDEVAWDFADFAIAWVLMAGVGLAYTLATRLPISIRMVHACDDFKALNFYRRKQSEQR